MVEVKWEEIIIPVPWGHIAGKWWGPQNIRPILVMHGWQDNCGSFDRLIPLLPRKFSYLAIDYPGHGLSSQIPPGMFYHIMDTVQLTERLKRHFGWTKVSLLGHSFGATANFLYTILFPNTVDILMCIDSIKPNPLPNSKVLYYTTKNIQLFFKYDAFNNLNTEPPSYAREELIQKLHGATGGSIALESCPHLLKRSVVESKRDPKRFYFSRDPRLKVRFITSVSEQFNEGTENVKCPVLVCSMTETPFYNEASSKQTCDIINQNNGGRCEFYRVEGSHHVHLNEPDVVN